MTNGFRLTEARGRASAHLDFEGLGLNGRAVDTIRALAERFDGRTGELVPGGDRVSIGDELLSIKGIGPWTVDNVLGSLADPDAVIVGDYSLPHAVAWLFEGIERSDDARMLELLEPFRGHRFRVIRLLWLANVRTPRRGPRLPFRRYRQ